MVRKRFTVESIVRKPGEAEVELSRGPGSPSRFFSLDTGITRNRVGRVQSLSVYPIVVLSFRSEMMRVSR